ncbi:hypothetical protein HGO36_13610 [Agrobacterium vitis]|nr:hypothetical protein [Agrobacterium vitis]MUO72746.1 hypothetical protein [Agrobacterium vitis]MUO86645.1 hypothetical protein [Agrobacterium vitis]MVA37422.1 hypothetical protein [Agrobacterium vitis]
MGRHASLIVNGETNQPLPAAFKGAGIVLGTLPENGIPIGTLLAPQDLRIFKRHGSRHRPAFTGLPSAGNIINARNVSWRRLRLALARALWRPHWVKSGKLGPLLSVFAVERDNITALWPVSRRASSAVTMKERIPLAFRTWLNPLADWNE